MATRELFNDVTARIIADMEKGVMPYETGFDATDSRNALPAMPINAATGKAYRGVNILLLWAFAAYLNSSDYRFLTYKQAQALGGQVKKGSKGTHIFFYSSIEKIDEQTNKPYTVPVMRSFVVFHVSQVEGCDFANPLPKTELPEDVSELIAALGVDVEHGTTIPRYNRITDKIHMPVFETFTFGSDYRATLYHEIIHWTGHASRCDREKATRVDSVYAFEELVAELGAAFLCAEYGLSYTTQHAAYISHWVKMLKEDSRILFKAASAAQKAIDFVREKVSGVAINSQTEIEPELALVAA